MKIPRLRFNELVLAGLGLLGVATSSCVSYTQAPDLDNISPDPIEGSDNDPDRVEWAQGYTMPFHTLTAALLPHTDIFWIGDGNHFDDGIKDRVFSDEAIDVYKSAKPVDFLVEVPSTEGVLTTQRLSELSTGLPNTDCNRFSRDAIKLNDNGVRVIGIDPCTYDEISEIGTALHQRYIASVGLAFANIDEDTEKAQRQQEIYNYWNFIFYRESHARIAKDPELAENVIAVAEQGNTVIGFYGAGHGSSDPDGMPDYYENKGFRCITVNMYASKEYFIEGREENQRNKAIYNLVAPSDDDINPGADLPDLVLLLADSNAVTVHFTDETPQYIRDIVPTLALLEPAPFTPK